MTLQPRPNRIIQAGDDGIRQDPERCHYCKKPLGKYHEPGCVTVTKIVKVRYSFELEIEVPALWSDGDVEFNRNEGSGCANNAVDDLGVFATALKVKKECLCGAFKCEVLG